MLHGNGGLQLCVRLLLGGHGIRHRASGKQSIAMGDQTGTLRSKFYSYGMAVHSIRCASTVIGTNSKMLRGTVPLPWVRKIQLPA